MHTLSIRTLADLAYESGREFDPAEFPSPDLIEGLALADVAGPIVAEPPPLERRRATKRRQRSERSERSAVPAWFQLGDLIDRPAGIHGELV